MAQGGGCGEEADVKLRIGGTEATMAEQEIFRAVRDLEAAEWEAMCAKFPDIRGHTNFRVLFQAGFMIGYAQGAKASEITRLAGWGCGDGG